MHGGLRPAGGQRDDRDRVDPGAIRQAHWKARGEQNGDASRNPEMCFEMQMEDGRLVGVEPCYYRNDYAGVEQFAQDEETGRVDTQLTKAQREFAALWSRNLFDQGFSHGYTEVAG